MFLDNVPNIEEDFSEPELDSRSSYPWEKNPRPDVMQTVLVRIPEPLYKKLKWVSKDSRISMNSIMKRLITVACNQYIREYQEKRKLFANKAST